MAVARQILSFLKRWPLHTLLVPVFFILSIYVQLAGLLYTEEVIQASLIVIIGTLSLFGILFLVYKDKRKAGFATTTIGILFLFFGDIKKILTSIPVLQYISSYRFMLPLSLLVIAFVLYKTKRTRSLATATLFLNILLLVYIAMDLSKWINLRSKENKGVSQPELRTVSIDPAAMPNIYYIVFDGYPSTQAQQEILGVSHNSMDSILSGRGFHLLKYPLSNYNYTSFSIASVFNMEYLDWVKKGTTAKAYHFSRSASDVSNSLLIDWLMQNGYSIYNLSVFDLPGRPSISRERFFFATTPAIIFHNTMWNRVKWDIIPVLFPSYTKKLVAIGRKEFKESIGQYKIFNRQVWDSLQQLPSSQRGIAPKFIYAHFEMPHSPYFYDSSGRPYPDEKVYSPNVSADKDMYRNYIGYVNNRISPLLDSIIHNGENNIIIFQSDHGSRDIIQKKQSDEFRNYSAFYFPDRDYHSLYDSMSNVNTFRIIFNKYFGQQLPLLGDSSIYVNY